MVIVVYGFTFTKIGMERKERDDRSKPVPGSYVGNSVVNVLVTIQPLGNTLNILDLAFSETKLDFIPLQTFL